MKPVKPSQSMTWPVALPINCLQSSCREADLVTRQRAQDTPEIPEVCNTNHSAGKPAANARINPVLPVGAASSHTSPLHDMKKELGVSVLFWLAGHDAGICMARCSWRLLHTLTRSEWERSTSKCATTALRALPSFTIVQTRLTALRWHHPKPNRLAQSQQDYQNCGMIILPLTNIALRPIIETHYWDMPEAPLQLSRKNNPVTPNFSTFDTNKSDIFLLDISKKHPCSSLDYLLAERQRCLMKQGRKPLAPPLSLKSISRLRWPYQIPIFQRLCACLDSRQPHAPRFWPQTSQ